MVYVLASDTHKLEMCLQRSQMPLPEKLKRKLLMLDTDGDGWMDRRVTLYALSTILRMVGHKKL